VRWSRGLAVAFVSCALAVCADSANAQDDRHYVAAFDRYMTPAAGTIDLLSIDHALSAVEDRWLPPARFDEPGWFKRALGIGYRFGKWYGLDQPQDHFVMVVAHEVFGHGSRLREIGADGIRYSFDAPTPYGGGGAVTEFTGEVLVTRADLLAIDTGGIEAQNQLADHIGRQSLAIGAIHYRDAWLYLHSRIDGLRYIRSVSPRSPPGHDVASFLEDVNDGCEPPDCSRLTASALKRRAWSMLADPMLAYAAYDWAVSYIVRGRTFGPLPMIPLGGDVGYLPALRFEMTPFGTEWSTDNYILRHGRMTTATIGIGDTLAKPAWRLGVIANDVVRRERWSADVRANIWRQPDLDSPPTGQVNRVGGMAAATARVRVGSEGFARRAGWFVEAGYKSDGFVRGERLHAGAILRVGVTLTR